MPRLGFSPAGCASHASIVVPSSTLISTCCEVMFDITPRSLSEFVDGLVIRGQTPISCTSEIGVCPRITKPNRNMTARFDSPQAIVTGGGCRLQAADLLASLGARRALVIVDPFFSTSGFVDEIRSAM